jgi:hypothetical protein
MKIDATDISSVNVGTLEFGEPFRHQGNFYIRVNFGTHRPGVAAEAFGLRVIDGLLTSFGRDTPVEPVEATFKVLP